ncbi:MAG: hypothetical protein WBZ42_03065 [Halobacteriota archaeon]
MALLVMVLPSYSNELKQIEAKKYEIDILAFSKNGREGVGDFFYTYT